MTIEVALSVMASARTGHLLVRDNDGLCTQLVTQVQLAAVRDGSVYTDRVQLRDILGDRGPFPSPVTSMAEAEHFRPASRRRGPPACSVPFPLASDAAAGSARDRARAPGPAAESPATACPDLLGPDALHRFQDAALGEVEREAGDDPAHGASQGKRAKGDGSAAVRRFSRQGRGRPERCLVRRRQAGHRAGGSASRAGLPRLRRLGRPHSGARTRWRLRVAAGTAGLCATRDSRLEWVRRVPFCGRGRVSLWLAHENLCRPE